MVADLGFKYRLRADCAPREMSQVEGVYVGSPTCSLHPPETAGPPKVVDNGDITVTIRPQSYH